MEKNTPLIISVTGWSGSGKTTFCERLISELCGRGMKVAAAKNSHKAVETDKPGSDSRRFFNAGAAEVCLNSENSMTLFYHSPLESDNMLSKIFADADIVIAEGFKPGESLRIEVTGLIESAADMKNNAAGVDLIIYGNSMLHKTLASDESLTCKAFIHRDDIKAAAEFICTRY